MKTLNDLSIAPDTKVILRTDLDVPAIEGAIQEKFRIEQQKETLDHLLGKGAKVLMVAHISAVDSFSSLIPALNEILGHDIAFVEDTEDIQKFLQSESQLGLLENTRKWDGEKDNDAVFAGKIAQGFDAYVNNAFAVCHRNHTSVSAIAEILPAYGGLLIEKETKKLTEVMNASSEGKVVVMGGAKASTKIPVIHAFVAKADAVLIGGVIANDILKEQGKDIGQSIVDDDTGELLQGINLQDEKLFVPVDFVIADEKILDIGEKTVRQFVSAIKEAKSIIWNGPMGMFEDARFLNGTKAVAQAIADSSALSIIGGGDTIAAVNQLGMLDRFSFVSTGGGAMLAFLAGKQLPGLKALGYYG